LRYFLLVAVEVEEQKKHLQLALAVEAVVEE
jgi:hypothetical protein